MNEGLGSNRIFRLQRNDGCNSAAVLTNSYVKWSIQYNDECVESKRKIKLLKRIELKMSRLEQRIKNKLKCT